MLLWLPACAERPPASAYDRTRSYALNASENTPLRAALIPYQNLHPDLSGFYLLTTGSDALVMRLAMVQAATKSIDLQYFSTRDDTTGKLLLEAVARAAARGVRVRMLIDDWNLDDFKAGAVTLDASPNIEIRVFNPYATQDQPFLSQIGNLFTRSGQLTRRMHNKALIVDNQLSVMGGRNLGDEYFDAGQDINFRDVDVLAAGPITTQISKNFDRYWNSDEAYPIKALNLPAMDENDVQQLREELHQHWQELLRGPKPRLNVPALAEQIRRGKLKLVWAPAEFASDRPEKIEKPVGTVDSPPELHIDRLVENARQEFIIVTPYFVPLNYGVDWLNGLVQEGIRVRILTNSLASTDVVPAYAGYTHYRAELLQGGVELYELKALQPQPIKSAFKPSSQNGLHAKIYLIDRRDMVLGSFNMDPRSILFNTEQVLIIHSPELGQQVAKLFEKITSPQSSYHLMLAQSLPPDAQPTLPLSSVVWVSEENGKITYQDFTPHAGFGRKLLNELFSILPIDDQL